MLIDRKVVEVSMRDEKLASRRAIGKEANRLEIGIHLLRLEPGQRTSWAHAEEEEESFVLVLEGEVDAWVDGILFLMRAGNLAAFPAGTGICRSFINNFGREARVLVGGERDAPVSGGDAGAITMSARDPLVHGDEDLIDDLCATFRAAALHGGVK